MPAFTYHGQTITIEFFGGSHEKEVGLVCHGLPRGLKTDFDEMRLLLSLRHPGQAHTTERHESDEPRLEGIVNGLTSGEDLVITISNQDVKSTDYATNLLRPAHADYPMLQKYGTLLPGSGPFSARMTAPFTALGGMFLSLLRENGIEIMTRIVQIGPVQDKDLDFENLVEMKSLQSEPVPVLSKKSKTAMLSYVDEMREQGDSIGGKIECIVTGLPCGLGGPGFEGLDGALSYAMFGIPAVRGIEFGDGFSLCAQKGSEANDAYTLNRDGHICLKSHHQGGILGGMSIGEPVDFRVAFKPTPTVSVEQDTVDVKELKEVKHSFTGRHDPCVVLRAAPIVRAATAITILDFMLGEKRFELGTTSK